MSVLGVVAILSAAFYALNAAAYLGTPLRFDETDFALAARATLRVGVPVMDLGYGNAVPIGDYFGYDSRIALWHPPLYIYTLAGAYGLLGHGDAVARALSAACLLTLLAVGLLIIRDVAATPGKRRFMACFYVVGLLATPLTLQGSFFVDIDNSLLAPLALLLLWLVVRLDHAPSWPAAAATAAVLAAMLWAKLTTPPLLLVAIGLHLVASRVGRRRLLWHALAWGGGVGIFAITWVAYCMAFGLPALFPIEFTFAGKNQIFTQLHGVYKLAQSLRWHVAWLSPGIFVLLAASAVMVIRDVFDGRRRSDNLFAWCALVVVGAYIGWFNVIGKYVFPAVPWLLLFVGSRLFDSVRDDRRLWRLAALAAGASAVADLVLIPDLLLRRQGFGPDADPLRDPRTMGLVIAAAIVVATMLFVWWRSRLPLAAAALLAGAAAMLPANLAQDVRSLSALNAPLRTLDEPGFAETLAFLNRTLRDADLVFGPKDIGYHLRRGRWLRRDGSSDSASVARWVDEYGATYLVESRFERLSDGAEVQDLLRREYARAAQFGVFTIYRRRA